ncbi:MAG: OsmC family protein [Acidobacteriota bacterium]
MPNRRSDAQWEGNLKDGKGTMRLGSGAFEGAFSFASRFENGTGTNPEELIAAAHAGCFSMALSHGLAQAGFNPTSVKTSATVRLEKADGGFKISAIQLETVGNVPGIDAETFQRYANDAKENCPVSKLVKHGANVTLQARLAT